MEKKNLTFGLIAISILFSLSGCMTTASNTRVSNIEPQQLGDNNLTCEQIKAQVQEMEQTMRQGGLNVTNEAVSSAATQAGTQVAMSAAAQAAPSAIPFLGPLIEIASSVSSQKQISAQQLASQAQARRQQLIYLYNSKGCK